MRNGEKKFNEAADDKILII